MFRYNNNYPLIDNSNNHYLCGCRACSLYESFIPRQVRNTSFSWIGKISSQERIRGRFLKKVTQRRHILNLLRTVRILSYERRRNNPILIVLPSLSLIPEFSTFCPIILWPLKMHLFQIIVVVIDATHFSQ
jgi:hypothetical protein